MLNKSGRNIKAFFTQNKCLIAIKNIDYNVAFYSSNTLILISNEKKFLVCQLRPIYSVHDN